jgi:hypothetical protein
LDENPKRGKGKLNKRSFLSLIFQTFQSPQPPSSPLAVMLGVTIDTHALAHCDDGKLWEI